MKEYAVVDEHGQFVRWLTPYSLIRGYELPEEYRKALYDEWNAMDAYSRAKENFTASTCLNGMCFECGKLNNGCKGERILTYTGCVFKVMKESEERKEVKRCQERTSKLNVVGS